MDGLVRELWDQDSQVQTEAFNALLTVLRQVGLEQVKKKAINPSHCFAYPNDLWQTILHHILQAGVSPVQETVLDILLGKALCEYADLRFYSLRNFAKILATPGNTVSADRLLRIFVSIRMPANEEAHSALRTLVDIPEDAELHFSKLLEQRNAYSGCCLALLPLLSPKGLFKFLTALDSKILPHLTQPLLLADFLGAACSHGGIVGILSLDALFTLMRTHNLDYPSFYPKLYALLTPQILKASYRARFFKIFATFMSSTMLPAYIVAAMVKRSLRLALGAPPAAIVWLLSFSYNMLWHHPVCRVLIHREENNLIDPYDAHEPDISRCQALQSSLWELDLLGSHYWPRISRLPGLFREKFNKPPFNLAALAEELEELSITQVISEELGHKWSRRPPTQLEVAETLF